MAGCSTSNASLTREKIPGSFGWDNTPSVVPASAVPGYHGTSPYLLVSKYNNYYRIGPHGDGHNEVALLDPRARQKDPYASVQTMKPVETVLSPVQVPKEAAGARYEWCINAAVFDVADHSVYVNNEDGILLPLGSGDRQAGRADPPQQATARGLYLYLDRSRRHGLRDQQRHALRDRALRPDRPALLNLAARAGPAGLRPLARSR